MPDLWSEGNSSLSVYLPLKSYEKIVGRVLRPRHGMPDLRHFDVTNSFSRHLADRVGPVGLASNIQHCSSGCSGYAAACCYQPSSQYLGQSLLLYDISPAGDVSSWGLSQCEAVLTLTMIPDWPVSNTGTPLPPLITIVINTVWTHTVNLIWSFHLNLLVSLSLIPWWVPHWFTQSEWMVGNL